MKLSFPTLANFRKHRAQKKLAVAIENHDLPKLKEALDNGARQIDYLMYRDGDRPGERVPAAKFTDVESLAQYVNLPPQGMQLLAQHGLVSDEHTPAAPRTVPRG